jgi:hypothetical protein
MGIKYKRQGINTLPSHLILDIDYFFLNLLLNPASPIRPEPRRNIVAGSLS